MRATGPKQHQEAWAHANVSRKKLRAGWSAGAAADSDHDAAHGATGGEIAEGGGDLQRPGAGSAGQVAPPPPGRPPPPREKPPRRMVAPLCPEPLAEGPLSGAAADSDALAPLAPPKRDEARAGAARRAEHRDRLA